MAPKFVLVTLVSVLVFFADPTQSKVLPPVPSPPMKSGPNYTAIAIGGEVFCRSCKLPGYVSNLNSSPVEGMLPILVLIIHIYILCELTLFLLNDNKVKLFWHENFQLLLFECRASTKTGSSFLCQPQVMQADFFILNGLMWRALIHSGAELM
jgi:hypothetical protein